MSTEIITSQEAIRRLRATGYHVEHSDGIIYARKSGNGTGLPDRLYERSHPGFVSALAVKRLETKIARTRA